MIKRYFKRLKTEFKGYNAGKFGKDVLAGITVAAGTSACACIRYIERCDCRRRTYHGTYRRCCNRTAFGCFISDIRTYWRYGGYPLLACGYISDTGCVHCLLYVGCYTSAVRNIQARRTGTVYTHACYHRLYIGYSNNNRIRSDKQPYGT